MAEVWIPVAMRNLTGGRDRVRVTGSTIRQVIDNLDEEHPGMKKMLCHDGEVMPGIAVVVDGETTSMGLLERVEEDSEVHFLPAIGGGTA